MKPRSHSSVNAKPNESNGKNPPRETSGCASCNTIPNPREHINSITTRSGLTTAESSIPLHVLPTPREEVEKESETLMYKVHIKIQASTVHVPPLGIQPVSPPKPKENPKPNLHQPKIPYPSRLDKTKLLDKNDVPEKLGDLRKFLIPCILQDLEVCNSLADSRASINLMPLSIYEQFRIEPLKSTRMTLELANQYVTYPMDFEVDPRVPIILGRPFLRTTKAFVDLYEEKLTLRIGNEELYESFHFDISFDLLSPADRSDSHLKEFADELAHIISPPEYDHFLL
ncbi:hypothetical protein Tco_1304643 [Tanacetum coccineum]